MIKFHWLKKTPTNKPQPKNNRDPVIFVWSSIFKLDVRDIQFVYQNTSKLTILMPSNQINEKSAGKKRTLVWEIGGQGVLVLFCHLPKSPPLFRQQSKGVGHNELQGLLHIETDMSP